MNNSWSSAQSAQQNNRDAGGRYTFGTHTEPDGLALASCAEDAQLAAQRQVDQAMAELNIIRSTIAKRQSGSSGPRPTNESIQSLSQAQQEYSAAVHQLTKEATRLYRDAGAKLGSFYAQDSVDARKLKRDEDGLIVLRTKRSGKEAAETKIAATNAAQDEAFQHALTTEKEASLMLAQAQGAYRDGEGEREAEQQQIRQELIAAEKLGAAHIAAQAKLDAAVRTLALHDSGFGEAIEFKPAQYQGEPVLSREPDGGMNVAVWKEDSDQTKGGSWQRALNALRTDFGNGNTLILEDGTKLAMGAGRENYKYVERHADVNIAVWPAADDSTPIANETGASGLWSNLDSMGH